MIIVVVKTIKRPGHIYFKSDSVYINYAQTAMHKKLYTRDIALYIIE